MTGDPHFDPDAAPPQESANDPQTSAEHSASKVVAVPTLDVRQTPGGQISSTLEQGASVQVVRMERGKLDGVVWALLANPEGWCQAQYLS